MSISHFTKGRRLSLPLALLSLLLTACPEPMAPSEGGPGGPGPGGGVPGPAGAPPGEGVTPASGADPASGGGVPAGAAAGSPGTPGTEAGAAGAPAEGTSGAPPAGVAVPVAGGTFSEAAPEAERKPKFTQEELETGSTIKGTLVCADCKGGLLVRVLPPPPDSPAEGAAKGLELITMAAFDKAGPFELKVPADSTSVVLQLVDDADKDGQPSAGERMGIPITGSVKVAALVEGVQLEIGVFPPMPPQTPK